MNEGKPGSTSASGEPGSTEPTDTIRPNADGDFELERPVGIPDGPAEEGDFELAQPAEERAATAPAERPRPLHDPDPYSTPPYGEPGPWAPAPPVQHPTATIPAQGAPAEPPPATPTPTPAAPPPTTPAPAAAASVPVQGPAAAEPTPVTPAPAASASAPTPVKSAPAPAPDAPAPELAAPFPKPADGAPAAAAAATVPAPHADAPAADSPAADPAASVPGASAPAVPAPASHAGAPASAVPSPAPQPGVTAPGVAAPGVAASGVTAPGGGPVDSPSPANPWQRYDPWAPVPAAGPLQQTGVVPLTERQKRRRAWKVLFWGGLVIALVSGSVGGVIGARLERDGGAGQVSLPQAGKEAAGRAPDSVAGIAARALPSVVTLHVTGAEESGTGTGFVLDAQGHILTNNHVVEPAGSSGQISVTFNSGDTAKATVVGRDSGYDLAVVKVSDVSGLKPMPLGNSDNVQVGDPVVAIGAPFDLEGTVTSGIISAKERPITAGGDSADGSDVSYVDALQTDAPINPGNSGGPLLDSQARVIGINSAIRSADDGSDSESGQAGSIGLGFAIPVNQAKRVAEELINTGKATHPVIGVTLDMDYTGDGARVGTKDSDGGPAVTPGGAGAKAGIKAGDVITEVDGQRIHSGDELIVKTRAHRPGDRLELTLKRDGAEKRITLVLGSSDSD